MRSVQARSIDVVPVLSSWSTAWSKDLAPYGPMLSFTQLDGPVSAQMADQPETRKRWSGSDQELTGSNMWSSRTKSLA